MDVVDLKPVPEGLAGWLVWSSKADREKDRLVQVFVEPVDGLLVRLASPKAAKVRDR
jgi:hypothetical protein